VVFPATPLDTRVELLLGGAWTDITAGGYVYQRSGPAQIIRGRPDESSQASPSAAALELNNRDGRFSPRNPAGAYYGTIGRNTPLRISVPEATACYRSETDNASYISAPDSVGLSVTGNLEIQIDMLLSDYRPAVLASKWAATGSQRSWLLSFGDSGGGDGLLRFYWSADGASAAAVTAALPMPLGRMAVKVTLATATGTVIFYTAATAAGPWTQLGPAAVLGARTVFDGTAPLVIGYQADDFPANHACNAVTGRLYAFKLLSGIGGTVKASPDFTTATPGNATLTDAQGNVFTLAGTAEFTGRKYRFHGEVPAWPPGWDATGTDVYTQINAAGILRRLTQPPGRSPLSSPMRRAFIRTPASGQSVPVAYWPGEDSAGSTQLASGLAGGLPMTGIPGFAASTAFACSAPLPLLANTALAGTVPRYTQPGSPANIFRFLLSVPAGGAPDTAILARMWTSGTVRHADLQYGTVSGGSIRLLGYDASGAQLFDTGYVTYGVNGAPLWMSLELQTSGANIQYSTVILKIGASSGTASGNPTVAGTVGPVTSIEINPGKQFGDTGAGHFSVQSSWQSLFGFIGPLNAWASESAGNRFARLCTEEGVACRISGHPDSSVLMGAQPIDTLINILQQCEDTDRGMIFEPRTALALGYRTRQSMEQQAAAVTLDYAHADLAGSLRPSDDDQLMVNDVTVTRPAGSSARAVLASGAASVQPPPAGIGTYDASFTASTWTDSLLADVAGWILHVRSADEMRYPLISANLARPQVAALYHALQDLDIGDRIDIANPPAWLPPGRIKQIAAGITEQLGGYILDEQWNTIPESPYETAIADDPVYGHADTDGCTLHANCTSTATSITADTAATFPLWTTAAADFPADVIMGGEQLTVTGITGAANPQTMTVTRSINGVVKAHTAGEDIRLAYPAILGM
jgi:hypothetical protein